MGWCHIKYGELWPHDENQLAYNGHTGSLILFALIYYHMALYETIDSALKEDFILYF